MQIFYIRSASILIYAVFTLQCLAQPSVSEVWVSESLLKKHVYTLASDSLQGRETGTIGQFRAAGYCLETFNKNHLQPIFQLDSVGASFLQKYYFTPALVSFFGRMAVVAKRSELSNPPSAENSQVLFAHNVGGLLVGTDLKNEIIIISAHYDHLGKQGNLIYNGADDNASGTASVLAIAAAFDSLVQQGIKPRRSILFLLFSGEEGGLIGSQYFVAASPFAMSQILCNLNVDMVGRTDWKHRKKTNYCYLITGKSDTELKQTIEIANQQTVKLSIDYSYDSENDPSQFYYRSDHYNFAKKGIPIAFFMDGEHPDYHQPSDTADKINYNVLQKRATLIFQSAWMMANPK